MIVIALLVIIALAHLDDAIIVAAALITLAFRAMFSYVGLVIATFLFVAVTQPGGLG